MAHPISAGFDGLLLGLFERAIPNLSDDDLDGIAKQAPYAINMVRQISVLCDGLGCVVSEDPQIVSAELGSFQTPEKLADMFFLLSNAASHAAATLGVAHSASSLQERRQLAAGAKVKGGRA